MELEERAEELLEKMWIRTEEGRGGPVCPDELGATEREAFERLLKGGYLSCSDGRIALTAKGRPEARNVVRRHRLAERLLADVLGARDMLIHEKACKFEHLLDRGLDESICTLLGHPKICPHGTPIPPGGCCQREESQAQKLLSPLSRLSEGQGGRIAYLYAPQPGKLQKLMAMGVLPGAPISVVRSFPSHVFQVYQTQFAVDREIADAIYVRLVEGGPAEESRGNPPHKPRWRAGGVGTLSGLAEVERGIA